MKVRQYKVFMFYYYSDGISSYLKCVFATDIDGGTWGPILSPSCHNISSNLEEKHRHISEFTGLNLNLKLSI
jgi:hypothetical protein